MALQLYLISLASPEQPEKTIFDGIHAIVFNNDDGDNDALKITQAEGAVQAAGFDIPDGYFDTVQLLGPPTSGIMTTELDVIVIRNRAMVQVIA